MLGLLVLMLLAAVGSVNSQDLGFGFSLKYVRMCLKPEFTRELAADNGTAEFVCASACARLGPSCQGFQLPAGGAKCRALVFDKCSPSQLVRTDCSDFAWTFVRNQPGLPDGQLCPDGFGSGYFGSTYKVVSAASWTAGRTACEAMPGLTKYADALERNETAHFHWIKTNVNSGKSFFIGGYRPGSAVGDPWFWLDCNLGLLPELWGPGQPNEGVSANRLDIWSTHSAGVEDLTDVYAGVTMAMCECINPFA